MDSARLYNLLKEIRSQLEYTQEDCCTLNDAARLLLGLGESEVVLNDDDMAKLRVGARLMEFVEYDITERMFNIGRLCTFLETEIAALWLSGTDAAAATAKVKKEQLQ